MFLFISIKSLTIQHLTLKNVYFDNPYLHLKAPMMGHNETDVIRHVWHEMRWTID